MIPGVGGGGAARRRIQQLAGYSGLEFFCRERSVLSGSRWPPRLVFWIMWTLFVSSIRPTLTGRGLWIWRIFDFLRGGWEPNELSADLMPEGGSMVDLLDLITLTENWLSY